MCSINGIVVIVSGLIPLRYLIHRGYCYCMEYCPECGSELSGEAQFCPDCGSDTNRVSKEEPVKKTQNTDRSSLIFESDLEEKIAYGGASVSVVGSFLPWASILGVTILGIEGNGIITLILASSWPEQFTR